MTSTISSPCQRLPNPKEPRSAHEPQERDAGLGEIALVSVIRELEAQARKLENTSLKPVEREGRWADAQMYLTMQNQPSERHHE